MKKPTLFEDFFARNATRVTPAHAEPSPAKRRTVAIWGR
jgi:hypothetical protein